MNAHHKRMLMSGLLVAETHLQAILTELESETGNFILYSKVDDIDTETKMRIRTQARLMFEQIRH
ncbi:MAG: hypothetical protein WBP64_12730, partial [Nitrososphaeraceae archaeon]